MGSDPPSADTFHWATRVGNALTYTWVRPAVNDACPSQRPSGESRPFKALEGSVVRGSLVRSSEISHSDDCVRRPNCRTINVRPASTQETGIFCAPGRHA